MMSDFLSDFQWYRILRGGYWVHVWIHKFQDGLQAWQRPEPWMNLDYGSVRPTECWNGTIWQRMNLIRPRLTTLRLLVSAVLALAAWRLL